MRFFKADEGPRSAEDEAAYTRLLAIADRSKIRDTIDFAPAPPVHRTDEPPAADTLL